MSKSVAIETSIGAGAVAASFIPGIGTLASAALLQMGSSMLLAGIAEEIASLSQQGFSTSSRTTIGPWQYVYGTRMVGGQLIFAEENSSQGTSNNKESHRVYAVACHPTAIAASNFKLYVNGKSVPLKTSGSGLASYSPTQTSVSIASIVRDANGVATIELVSATSGLDGETVQVTGSSDNTLNGTWILSAADSGGLKYAFICGGTAGTYSGGSVTTTYPDYSNKIYVEFLNGAHASTFQGLLDSSTSWGDNDLCLGRTLVYVRMGYAAAYFPGGLPEVRFVFEGKSDIYDPRDGKYKYTNNAALCIADYLSLPVAKGGFGLTIGTDINASALSTAANVCDESITTESGTVARYTCDAVFQLSQTRGAILRDLLSSCAGRISTEGGIYGIHPAVWSPTGVTLTDADIISVKLWPILSFRDSFNGVKGVYCSPSNNYERSDYPAYMQDTYHGFTTDTFKTEDGGERIWGELNLPCTASSPTAQRLAKIALWRTRCQMRATLRCKMGAYRLTSMDQIQVTHPRYTWNAKYFEVLESRLVQVRNGAAVSLQVELDIAEISSEGLEWSLTEEQTPQGYSLPSSVGNSVCNPPENVYGYSGTGTTSNGITFPDTIQTTSAGVARNSLYLRWDTPNDANVTSGGHIEVQYMESGDVSWTALANISSTASCTYITNVSDGDIYYARVRAVNCANVPSAWVQVGPVTICSSTSSATSGSSAVAASGTLFAEGMSDGTAQISILDFVPTYSSIACVPSPSTLTGLKQSTMYYVYYVDSKYACGTITPIATTSTADFTDKTGYFLIGSLTTPTYTPRYYPTTYSDIGNNPTTSPALAYDESYSTYASVVATSTITGTKSDWDTDSGDYVYSTLYGACTYSGFSSVTTTAAMTLYVIAAYPGGSFGAGSPSVTIQAKIGSTSYSVATFTTAVDQGAYVLTIPSGTNLSTVSVTVEADPPTIPATSTDNSLGGGCSVSVYEVFIQ